MKNDSNRACIHDSQPSDTEDSRLCKTGLQTDCHPCTYLCPTNQEPPVAFRLSTERKSASTRGRGSSNSVSEPEIFACWLEAARRSHLSLTRLDYSTHSIPSTTAIHHFPLLNIRTLEDFCPSLSTLPTIVHHGGIRTSPDLWDDLRDHVQVRGARAKTPHLFATAN